MDTLKKHHIASIFSIIIRVRLTTVFIFVQHLLRFFLLRPYRSTGYIWTRLGLFVTIFYDGDVVVIQGGIFVVVGVLYKTSDVTRAFVRLVLIF
jgi:hypothetical protein